jgi:ubiquinone/menaquinone biosynthesis C-methylase UbiE
VADWGLGEYERVAEQLLPAAEVVVDTADPTPGETVIDVGCGTGNAALIAAQRGATVIGVDPAQRLLEVAAAAAEERDLDAEFVLGEAASMPVSNAEADVVLSVFGVIFAEDAPAAAAELARVSKPQGRILIAAWIPDGAISRAVRLTAETVADAMGQPPPTARFAWHERAALEELFSPHDRTVSLTEHTISFRAPSAREFVEREADHHPLAVAARPALEKAGRADALRADLIRLYEEASEDPSGFRITSRYVVAEIRPDP